MCDEARRAWLQRRCDRRPLETFLAACILELSSLASATYRQGQGRGRLLQTKARRATQDGPHRAQAKATMALTTTQAGAEVIVAHPWGKAAAMRYAIPTEPSRATVHLLRSASCAGRALASVPCRCFCTTPSTLFLHIPSFHKRPRIAA